VKASLGALGLDPGGDRSLELRAEEEEERCHGHGGDDREQEEVHEEAKDASQAHLPVDCMTPLPSSSAMRSLRSGAFGERIGASR
jgi:hypothetical protein